MDLTPDEHGRYSGTKRGSRLLRRDPLISYEPFVTERTTKHTLVIDGFRIDQFADVVIHRTTGEPHLTHARFTLADYSTRVASWYEPVVRRLFWLGFPVLVHSRSAEGGHGLYRRMMAAGGLPLTWPQTVTLDDDGEAHPWR